MSASQPRSNETDHQVQPKSKTASHCLHHDCTKKTQRALLATIPAKCVVPGSWSESASRKGISLVFHCFVSESG